LPARAAALQAFEDGGEVLLAVQTDADRDVDLSMQNVFGLEPLHEAMCDEFVVCGRLQVLGDGLEGHEKPGEVGILVELLSVGECGSFQSVTVLDFQQGGRVNRAFEVEVEFGLGKRGDEGAGLRVGEQAHGV